MAEDFDAAIESNGRRAFLKKLAIGTAFATPVVSSFSMSGINAVYAADRRWQRRRARVE